MCADKAKENSTNSPSGAASDSQVDNVNQDDDKLITETPRTDNDAAGKLRKLFSDRDSTKAPEANETAQQLPAMPPPAKRVDPDSTSNTLPAMGTPGLPGKAAGSAPDSKPAAGPNKTPSARATQNKLPASRSTQTKLPASPSGRSTQTKLPASQSNRSTQNRMAAQGSAHSTQNKLPAEIPQTRKTQNSLPAVPTPVEKAVAETKNQRRHSGRNAKDLNQCVTRRTLDGTSKTSTFVVLTDNHILRTFQSSPKRRVEQAIRRIPDHFLELDIKNFKGHVFLQKDCLQSFAARIKEVTRDWEDFRFVDPADDVEWHRTSLNQAINEFMDGLGLPPVRLALDEKARDTIEPQYSAGSGTITVRPDDIRSAVTVDVSAVYHDLVHAEQDTTIIRRLALSTSLNKSPELNSAEILGEYCRQTGLDPASVSRDWIHSVIQASSEWLKNKIEEIKRLQRRNSNNSFDELFARDRELVRAKELTDAICERSTMFKHLTRKHQLLVNMHREFTQNLEPHVYVERFETRPTFQRMLLGYDWDNLGTCNKEEFGEILASRPELLQSILFNREEDLLPSLPRHLSIRGFEPLAIMKVRALARAFELEVIDKTDPMEIERFDEKYAVITRRIASEVEDEFAEQIRLQRVKHYLGVEQELEANHAAFMINQLCGPVVNLASKPGKSESKRAQEVEGTSASNSSKQDSESSTKLSVMTSEQSNATNTSATAEQSSTTTEQASTAPEQASEAGVTGEAQTVVETPVVTTNAPRTAADIIIARNKRVVYRGLSWLVVDFNQETGDAILQRSEERTMSPDDVFMGARNLSINESYRITVGEGHDDGWFYRGRDDSGNLRMFKPNATRIEVPKLALQSVNQLLANARVAASISMTNLPRMEFPKAGGGPVALPKKHDMTWTGSNLGSFLIEELVSDRQYYWVYKGIDQNNLDHKIFKVAKPPEYLGDVSSVDPLKSTVLKLTPVGFSPTIPNVSELLRLQCERMSNDGEHIMAKIEEVSCTDALCYSRMEYIDGVTLRELREHGPISLELGLDIVSALDTIQSNTKIGYHGNLTPDNIMLSYSTVKLLDSGYFGALDCAEGMCEECAITTPAYYPFLAPNDMLALGIIFWELHFGINPFASFKDLPATIDGVNPGLLRVLKGYSSIGRPFVNAMALVPTPRSLEPDIHPELERFLLACLGLRINEHNELDAAARYETFTQIGKALCDLAQHGITDL